MTRSGRADETLRMLRAAWARHAAGGGAGTPDFDDDDAVAAAGEPPAPLHTVRITLGAWDYIVDFHTEDRCSVSAAPRRAATRVFACSNPGQLFAPGPVSSALVLERGVHALYALSGQGKSRSLDAIHARLGAVPTSIDQALGEMLDPLEHPVSISFGASEAHFARAGEPDGAYDPTLAAMAGSIAWAMIKPGRTVTVDSVTDLSRVSGDGGTMSGGLSSGFATDLRHLSAAMRARGSVLLLVVNPLSEGTAAGLFREALFGSLTGMWAPTDLGAGVPTGSQRGPGRNSAGPMWAATSAPQQPATAAVAPSWLGSATLATPFGQTTRPFTY